MDIREESIELHAAHHGKLEVKSKVPLRDKHDLALAYTPGVAAVSSLIAGNKALARGYTLKGSTVAIISDGSSVLGLGNLGPEAAIPVMEGKAILFKELAGVDAFPICLATQDTEEIIRAVKQIAPVFGGINLEDIAAPRCFEIERRLQEELDIPVMHDDQHGTATVVLAGLINALALKKIKKEDTKVVVNGAGAAGIAIAKMLVAFGVGGVIVCDTRGVIVEGRSDLSEEKNALAQITNREKRQGTLADVLEGVDVFVGVSRGDLLSAEMVRAMAPQPIIFALANPVPEIMPNIAKAEGAFIVATGRSDFPNQVNNSLVFPGIFRGALDKGISQFTDKMFLDAATRLAASVKDLSPEQILPDALDRGVVSAVASAIL